MREFDDCRPFVEHLRIEHGHIERALHQLHQLFDASARTTTLEGVSGLIEQLQVLRSDLARHFREEEEGGCLEEAQSRCPCLAEDVEKILVEHQKLLEELDLLIQRARSLARFDSALQAMRLDFSAFAKRLHAHEAEENRILLMGFGSQAMDSLSAEAL